MALWWSTVLTLLAAIFGGAVGDPVWVVDTQQQGGRFARDISSGSGSVSMTKLVIDSSITYRYAKTTIFNTIANNAQVSNEITFKATLPEAGYISAFHIEVGGQSYVGEVKLREEAEEIYRAAKSEGKTAAKVTLAAQSSSLFMVSVNVEANEKVSFNLTYEELLVRNQGGYTHLLYVDPGQIVDDMAVIINIRDTANIVKLVVEPLRPLDDSNTGYVNHLVFPIESRPTPTSALIEWEPTPEEQQAMKSTGVEGRFIVKYDVARDSNPNQILVSQDYFVHFYAPTDLEPMNKHVVFVLDTSGSMDGNKLPQLKDAMMKILEDLRPNDYLTVVEFNSVIKAFLKSGQRVQLALREHVGVEFVIEASPTNVQALKSAIKGLTATGGTNIYDSLLLALEVVDVGEEKFKVARKRLEPMIIFLTDGEPNEGGQTLPNSIVATVVAANVKATSIHSLGFGDGASMPFLRNLSEKTGGQARRIHERSDAASQLIGFYMEVASAVTLLRDFKMGFKNVVTETVTKLGLKNLYEGSEWVTAGRAKPQQAAKIRATGSGMSSTGSYNTGFPRPLEVPASSNFLERLWAYLTIRQLLEDQAGISTASFVKAQSLALKYSFVTPLTSLVVVRPAAAEVDVFDVRIAGSLPEESPALSFNSNFNAVNSDNVVLSHQGALLNININRGAVLEINTARPPPPTLGWDSSVFLNSTVKITKGGSTRSYEIASNPLHLNSRFDACRLPTGVQSHCKHLNACILPDFQNNFALYESSYFCSIEGSFAGVCCP